MTDNKTYIHTKVEHQPCVERKAERKQSPQAKGEFSFDTIHGLPLEKVAYTVPAIEERREKRDEFDGVYNHDRTVMLEEGMRGQFLKHLANDPAQRDLLKKNLGFCEEQINIMAEKGYAPNGYNVHHKLALHGGGKNEFSNFILMPIAPHDQLHKDVMDHQLQGMKEGETREILIPAGNEMIYDPKKFGYTKENQKVEPNYTSAVDFSQYSANYTVAHVNNIRAKQLTSTEIADSFKQVPQEKKKKTQQNPNIAHQKKSHSGR